MCGEFDAADPRDAVHLDEFHVELRGCGDRLQLVDLLEELDLALHELAGVVAMLYAQFLVSVHFPLKAHDSSSHLT